MKELFHRYVYPASHVFTLCSLTPMLFPPDRKKMAEFEKENRANMAIDAEGCLSFLTTSEWQLEYCMKQWSEIEFYKTREVI